jgi:hypothetical protein
MTMLDVLGAVELTASAAIAVAVFSIGLGRDGVMRRRLAIGLGAWFTVVVVLAATRALSDDGGTGVPGVGLAAAVPVVVLTVALFRVAALREGMEGAPLSMLVAAQGVRVFGLNFVLLYAAGRLPAPFAPVAGWGDVFIGATALPVAWIVARRAAGWRGVLLGWNVLGLLDLAAAVTLGVLSANGPLRVFFGRPGTDLMSGLPWLLIPGFLVPLLAVGHLVIFWRVRREEDRRRC